MRPSPDLIGLSAVCLALASTITASPHSGSSSPHQPRTSQWDEPYALARKFVSQMTLEEKVNITGGFPADNVCGGNSGSVPRLGWQGMCLHDAGNGVRATDFVSSYPSGIHAGASWDRNLTYWRGLYMGKEFKAKGANVLLGPNAGPLGRLPVGGRNWEGFSVDPYLSGQLNAETIIGNQEAGVIANLKHFIANEQETHRKPYHGLSAVSSNLDDRTLHELYLWPFMDGVRAGVASVMCSYNRVNGTYACENQKLIDEVLRGELEFDGFVLLDWSAQHSLPGSVDAGLDMTMPDRGVWGENLTRAVEDGVVEEEKVTEMAVRILAAWYLLNQDQDFPPPGIGIKNLTQPHDPVEARIPDSAPIILEGAIAGHVLLKNENDALPFSSQHPPKMLSIFGYDAHVAMTKSTDNLFQLGYASSPEMGDAELGDEHYFDQAARGGTIVVGGRAGANAPPYISDPLSALQNRAYKDNTWLNWDLTSSRPPINGATTACLVFINAMSTEGWDRTGLHDTYSDELVEHVASHCANTIVVIHAAGIRLVDPWIDHPNVTAVVLAQLPGQDSGRALVKLLYGEENFSGKLPYTLAKKEEDYPVTEACTVKFKGDTDPKCEYDEGVYLDYRWFDAKDITPRYEFGYGLSYASFSYSNLSISSSTSSTNSNKNILHAAGPHTDFSSLWQPLSTIRATIRNTGSHHPGAEVAQLYLAIPGAGDDVPARQLRGFDKIPLGPGEEGEVVFELTRRDLSVWDVVSQRWVVREGEYGVFVGASSRDIRLEGVITVAKAGQVGDGDGEDSESGGWRDAEL